MLQILNAITNQQRPLFSYCFFFRISLILESFFVTEIEFQGDQLSVFQCNLLTHRFLLKSTQLLLLQFSSVCIIWRVPLILNSLLIYLVRWRGADIIKLCLLPDVVAPFVYVDKQNQKNVVKPLILVTHNQCFSGLLKTTYCGRSSKAVGQLLLKGSCQPHHCD